MQVETYEIQEVQEETTKMTQDAVGIIEMLGLEGQKKLLSKTEKDTSVKRCPYRTMKRDEIFVFEILCPLNFKIEEYSESAIPLRVLQVLAHAKELGLFKAFRIKTAEGQIKDPVLVAYNETWCGNPSGKVFILARWADELDEWPALVKKAIERYRSRYKKLLIEVQQKVIRDLAIVDNIDIETAMTTREPFYLSW